MNINTNAWNRFRYSLYAPLYDLIGSLFNKDRRRSIQTLDLQPGEKVLLVGAGTGIDIQFLPEDVCITAIDITPVMVRKIETHVNRLNRQVDTFVMDGQALDFPDEVFDVVILHLILAVIPDHYACISEVARVLKSDGRVAIFDKFLPGETDIRLGRKIANVIAGFFFSEINRRLQPIITSTSLEITYQESASFEKMGYQITTLKKTTNGNLGENND